MNAGTTKTGGGPTLAAAGEAAYADAPASFNLAEISPGFAATARPLQGSGHPQPAIEGFRFASMHGRLRCRVALQR
jgi:hypothetical protein